MEYRFENDGDYFYFQDVFSDYQKHDHDPFHRYVDNRFDRNKEVASNCIGKAHYRQFVNALSIHGLSELALSEASEAKDVFLELNIAIVRHEIGTRLHSFPSRTEKQIQEHVNLFPCSFSHHWECLVSLPKRYETLLDRIIDFEDAVLRFDVDALTAYLCGHYQNLDEPWVKERLAFLGRYYCGNSFIRDRHEMVLAKRRELR